jgi:hypothetical protein
LATALSLEDLATAAIFNLTLMLSKISIAEFKDRLEVLCLRGGGQGFPRKQRDQHILFKSIILMLETRRDYTENEVNECLAKWLSEVGQAIEIDHVSLRRYLVDAGYLTRDAAGRSYRVDPEQTAELFEAGIEEINLMDIVAEASKRTEKRKREYLEKRGRA